MRIPQVEPLAGASDFHDSSLIDIAICPFLRTITVILSTPDEQKVQHIWQLKFSRVLRFEFEILGDGESSIYDQPLEVYDVYDHCENPERMRWVERLRTLDVNVREAENVKHIVLASSFVRGIGKREDLEGITIVCRDVEVSHAPARYKGQEFDRPWIPGAPDDDGSVD